MHVLITGTSRGIGLELCRIALGKGHDVCAVARNPNSSTGLQSLAKEYSNKLVIAQADVTEASAPKQILEAIKNWNELDVLINNAGILDQTLSEANLLKSFQVNSIAPLMLAQALLPKLKKSTRATTVNITSRMGSIEDNTSGGYYAYRASKAALNMLNKSLSIDNPWLTTVVVHPGWVQTDMGGSGAMVKVSDSADGIWKIADSHGKTKSGSFVDYQGKALPW